MKALSRINGCGERYILTSTGSVLTRREGKIIKLSTQIINSGYELIHISINKKRKAMTMHRLVAMHFIPNPDNKPCVNHKDGNKLNNDSENLEWSTYSENVVHAHETGLLVRKGQKNGMAKLNDAIVLDIKEMIASGFTNKAIGEKYSVDPSTISVIRHGKTWAHVAPPFKQIEIFS